MYIFKRTSLSEEIWGTQKLLTGLHSWVITLRNNTTCYYFRDLHLQETTSSHFLPADPACRQAVPGLARAMEEQFNYSLCDWDLFSSSLWNHLSQTATPVALYLHLEIMESWVLSLQYRRLLPHALLPGLLLLLFLSQICYNKHHFCFHYALAHNSMLNILTTTGQQFTLHRVLPAVGCRWSYRTI